MTNWKWFHTLGLFGLLPIIVYVGGSKGVDYEIAFYTTIVLMIALASIIGHGVTGFRRGILIDEANRISLSRFQLTVWTIVILSALLTAAFGNLFRGFTQGECKGPLDIEISRNVWALLTMSVTTAVAALLINQQNRLRKRPQVTNQAATGASWGDLFVATEGTGRVVDITRVQHFYFTVVLVICYTALLQRLFDPPGAYICKFPELTPGMLTLLGISHAGYVIPKAIPR